MKTRVKFWLYLMGLDPCDYFAHEFITTATNMMGDTLEKQCGLCGQYKHRTSEDQILKGIEDGPHPLRGTRSFHILKEDDQNE